MGLAGSLQDPSSGSGRTQPSQSCMGAGDKALPAKKKVGTDNQKLPRCDTGFQLARDNKETV